MADGSSKPIGQVKVGDRIQNALPGVPKGIHDQSHVVTAVHVTYTDRDYTDVTVDTGHGTATIAGTAHHLYWDDTTHQWTDADHLHLGDQLQTTNGNTTTITGLRDYTATMVTYNLTIDNLHTYYVQADTTPILVHNCPADDSGGASKRGRAQGLTWNNDATGDHTVFEQDENGKVTRYQTWLKNDYSPSGWQKGPRFRGTGGLHYEIEPPIYYPTGGGLGIPGADVPESIPPGYSF